MLRNIISLVLLIVFTISPVFSCTRVLKVEPFAVLVGRNMDWAQAQMQTELVVWPRQIAKQGLTFINPMRWTAQYGSLVATAYIAITTDGLNEKGLAAHILWLKESDFGTRNEALPAMSVTQWAQFYLDNFATVAEAVHFTETTPFQLLPYFHPETKKWVNLHLALEDAQGDSAIIEYIAGKPHIYHHRAYTVLTNSPTYDQQLQNNKLFKNDQPLPGTTDSVDRFQRASFYVKRLPDTADIKLALAEVGSIMDNVSEPYGSVSPERDDISPTRWRSVSDLTHKIYYFYQSPSLNRIWVPLDKLNFQAGEPVRTLAVEKNLDLMGDVSNEFKVKG